MYYQADQSELTPSKFELPFSGKLSPDNRYFTGYYPSSVHVDKIDRTRANRAWCKERGIRLSGSPLVRKPKKVSKEAKKQAQDDERFRNAIEGKFGEPLRWAGSPT